MKAIAKLSYLPIKNWSFVDQDDWYNLIHRMNLLSSIIESSHTSAIGKHEAKKEFSELQAKAQKIKEKYRRIK